MSMKGYHNVIALWNCRRVPNHVGMTEGDHTNAPFCPQCNSKMTNPVYFDKRTYKTKTSERKNYETSRGFNFAKAISPENRPT